MLIEKFVLVWLTNYLLSGVLSKNYLNQHAYSSSEVTNFESASKFCCAHQNTELA